MPVFTLNNAAVFSVYSFPGCSGFAMYWRASLKNAQIMTIMIRPMGKAEMMLTLWILFMLLSEKTRAMGRTIRRMHQRKVIVLWGFSSAPSFR